MSDPLSTVLRLRRITLDDARRGLAEVLRAADQSEINAVAAEAAISAEGEAAVDMSAGDGAVEAYAAWLPIGRARAVAARKEAERAQSDISKARAALTAARAAAEAAESLLARRRAEEAVLAGRRVQADLDEIGNRVNVPTTLSGPADR